MSRFVWLTACLAVLFGLQGALCAAACLAETTPTGLASTPGPAMPCHEETPAHEPTPAEPEKVCGCATSLVAEADIAIDSRCDSDVPLPAPVFAWYAPPAAERPGTAASGRTPPPDILLQSSILLL